MLLDKAVNGYAGSVIVKKTYNIIVMDFKVVFKYKAIKQSIPTRHPR